MVVSGEVGRVIKSKATENDGATLRFSHVIFSIFDVINVFCYNKFARVWQRKTRAVFYIAIVIAQLWERAASRGCKYLQTIIL